MPAGKRANHSSLCDVEVFRSAACLLHFATFDILFNNNNNNNINNNNNKNYNNNNNINNDTNNNNNKIETIV